MFDKKICEETLDLYRSGSDICCYWPPQIIAAAMIKKANEKL
jgi:hypothetical protein